MRDENGRLCHESLLPPSPALAQGRKVCRPFRILVAAEFVKVIPAVKACVVTVVEDNARGVVADRFDRDDLHVPLSGNGVLLGGGMPLHLGAWRFDTKIFRRQRKRRAAFKRNL
jgi:hypothetical protein